MDTSRRAFVRLAAGGAMGGLLSLAVGKDAPPPGIKIGSGLNPKLTDQDLEMFRNRRQQSRLYDPNAPSAGGQRHSAVEHRHPRFALRSNDRTGSSGPGQEDRAV